MRALLKKVIPGTVVNRVRKLRACISEDLMQLNLPSWYGNGCRYGQNFDKRPSIEHTDTTSNNKEQSNNPLWNYFNNHDVGHGIWKWEHYFDIYHHHFSKFVGTPVKILEIGIYSRGSLEMWRSYFGKDCHIYGVDIEESCKSYENDNTTIFIGDQEEPDFWNQFNEQVNGVDIIIDDGGHSPNQQKVTLESMLPFVRPGGVYLCEDIHGVHNNFAAYICGLISELNRFTVKPTPFQSKYHSIHFYPYLVVIEKYLNPISRFNGSKRGSVWQPFFDK